MAIIPAESSTTDEGRRIIEHLVDTDDLDTLGPFVRAGLVHDLATYAIFVNTPRPDRLQHVPDFAEYQAAFDKKLAFASVEPYMIYDISMLATCLPEDSAGECSRYCLYIGHRYLDALGQAVVREALTFYRYHVDGVNDFAGVEEKYRGFIQSKGEDRNLLHAATEELGAVFAMHPAYAWRPKTHYWGRASELYKKLKSQLGEVEPSVYKVVRTVDDITSAFHNSGPLLQAFLAPADGHITGARAATELFMTDSQTTCLHEMSPYARELYCGIKQVHLEPLTCEPWWRQGSSNDFINHIEILLASLPVNNLPLPEDGILTNLSYELASLRCLDVLLQILKSSGETFQQRYAEQFRKYAMVTYDTTDDARRDREKYIAHNVMYITGLALNAFARFTALDALADGNMESDAYYTNTLNQLYDLTEPLVFEHRLHFWNRATGTFKYQRSDSGYGIKIPAEAGIW